MTYTASVRFSTETQQLETNIRNRCIRALLKANAYGKQTLPALQTMFKDESTASLIVQTYVNAKQYEDLDTIQDELNSGSGRDESQLAHQAVHAYRYTTSIMDKPIIEDYTTLLTNVNASLSQYKTFEKSDERVHDAIGDILSCLLDYAQISAERYEQYRDMSEHDMSEAIKAYSIDLSSSSAWTGTYSVDVAPLKKQILSLADNLKDEGTYEEVVKFILNREIGSYGSAYIPDLSSPLFVSVIPDSFQSAVITSIWKKRLGMISDANLDSRIREIDDADALSQARSILNSLSTNSLPSHRDASIKRSMRKKSTGNQDDDDDAAGFGLSFTSTPIGKSKSKGKKREKRRKGDESPFVPEGSQTMPTPDDSDVSSDPILVSVAYKNIKYVQALPDDDMRFDHMTRFSTESEAAISITRSQIRQGDQQITRRDRYGNQSYVVTFTRKSRKPIFNPVN